jgi:hypothetical protein
MKWTVIAARAALRAGLILAPMLAQSQTPQPATPASPLVDDSLSGGFALDWTPPALAVLGARAVVKSSFTMDRTMLGVAAGLVPDTDRETRQAIDKLDGVSVHVLRFGATGTLDEAQVEAVREAYHQRGWKHLVTTVTTAGRKTPLQNGTTDVWLVVEGLNVRGAAVLVRTPKSLTLVTLKGNLSPVDLLHLRGHFGIPRFEGDGLKDTTH